MTLVGEPGCPAYIHHDTLAPTVCGAPPEWAGLAWGDGPPPTVWLIFSCDRHRDHLIAPRRLLDRDHAEIDRRREQHRAVLQDKAPHVPAEPLARGRAARQLLERAKAYSARHPEG